MIINSRQEHFRSNDLDDIYYKRFEEIWSSGDIYADPSGWRDTEAIAAELLPAINVDKTALGRYYLDEGNTLGTLKDQIRLLIDGWEQRILSNDEVTLYNSVSTATAASLVTLHRLGLRTIIFETPAYGVTINQARQVGYNVVLVPTYYRDGFRSRVEHYVRRGRESIVIWLTQPRMSLGIDQDLEFVNNLLDGMSANDVLVIDEATEQCYPARLRHLHQAPKGSQVVRIRGIVKPIGLNGLRVAAILHSASLRGHLEDSQDVIGASLDFYSLQMAANLAQQNDLFRSMLLAANAQVRALCKKAEALALGSGIVVNRLENGYMGSVLVPFSDSKKYTQNREALLRWCHSRHMPVILGSNMYFAFDATWEQIRFNYFNRDYNIIRAIEVLSDFSATLRQ